MRKRISKKGTCKKIANEMDSQGISVSEMAEALDISYQAVYQMKQGEKMPTLKHLFTISRILGRKIDDLVVEEYV